MTPVEEVLASLDTLVQAGKVRSIGLSEVPAFPAAQELGIAICPCSPLAGGLLSRKYRRGAEPGRTEGRPGN
jgi:aryl-alcohol dehydrogenase-like predicted oxidoreductase